VSKCGRLHDGLAASSTFDGDEALSSEKDPGRFPDHSSLRWTGDELANPYKTTSKRSKG
jgi:hypothetical protein